MYCAAGCCNCVSSVCLSTCYDSSFDGCTPDHSKTEKSENYYCNKARRGLLQVGPQVGPPSTSVKHTVYEEISTLDEHSLTENVNSDTKTSPQKFYNKVSEFEAKRAQDPDPVQNPAYGTNTTAAAQAPNINTEKNKAYHKPCFFNTEKKQGLS